MSTGYQSKAKKREAEEERSLLGAMKESDLGKRIASNFQFYDKIGNQSIDPQYLGDVIRSLGCVPSEAEIEEIRSAVTTPEVKEIMLEKFLPVTFNKIVDGQMRPSTKLELLQAFRKLDEEDKGYLERGWLEGVLGREGEAMNSEELQKMMSRACDPDSGLVDYLDYVNQLEVKRDVYGLVPQWLALLDVRSSSVRQSVRRSGARQSAARQSALKEKLKPGLFTSGDTRKDCLTLFSKLIRTKNIESLQEEELVPAKPGKTKLKKCLTTLDLTSLGVGSCVATGMYLVAGMVAKNIAGPGVIFSFIIAAVASLFSGACYAEFGVRVPKTTGSAYMYSYVTVGEGVAFIIGWNMVLEYLIGTAACASALSACFNTIAGGAISDGLKKHIGTIIGTDRPPDVVAFGITLLMMLVIAAGVKKSLIFNNILNVINLAAWVFLMSAGLFYVDTNTWSNHKGFLPFGWSGVFTGAATCFYAFIGFDIIATTGEEANNPKKSIPLAILTSLAIILVAYVTSSIILTLIIPYEEIDAESGLVAMFGQVGATKCKCIIAAGGIAGLTVSMFGSMFPMPRIVYAMAHDGLIFRSLSQIFPATGTPVVATFTCGIGAAIASLIISLDVLVEMMSIGTLLAYTLVSTCVLILRYQPHTTNLMELLPESLRTPIKGSPSKEAVGQNGQVSYGNQLKPDILKSALSQVTETAAPPQRVMVRRVTRSSPDSDDTMTEELEDGVRDDQFLVSDASENKFYGTVHGGGSTSGASALPGAPALSHIARKIQAATYLCPAIFPWVDTGPATEESGLLVMKLVALLYLLIFLFDLTIVVGMGSDSPLVTVLVCILLPSILAVLLVISRKPQNRKTLMFMTPGLPFVPAIAVMVNIYLIFKLSILTLVRFTVWMTIGVLVYFYYGIKHSSLEDSQEGGLEMSGTVVPTGADGREPEWTTSYSTTGKQPQWQEPENQWQQPPSRPAMLSSDWQTSQAQQAQQQPSSQGAANPLFVSPTHFPTWDD